MLRLAVLLGVLACLLRAAGAGASPPAGRLIAEGLATVYGWPADRYSGGDWTGCPAVSLARYGTRRLTEARRLAWGRDRLWIVALRPALAKCGAIVEVRGNGHVARALVADRGPWGQTCLGQPWSWALDLRPGCSWRGVADLPPDLGALVFQPGRLSGRVAIYRTDGRAAK